MNFQIDKLKESTDFTNYILDNISSAVFLVDNELRVQSFNNAFTTLFKTTDEKIMGQLCGNAIGCVFTILYQTDCGKTPKCGECNIRNSIIKSFLEKVPVYNQFLERVFVRQNTETKLFFNFSTKYIDYNGNTMVLVIVNDITEIEDSRRKLEHLNEEKNKFIGIAAHDLRNPLFAIGSFAKLIKENYDNSKKEKFLDYISELSDSALVLLNDMLDISKIESGTLNFKKEKINYTNFINEFFEINFILAKNKNISIKLIVTENLHIYADKNLLNQVIYNLYTNAVKYSESGTEIKINSFIKENNVVTEIIDQGQGIKKEEIQKLFKPFSKTSSVATNNETSTGLGLSIVKKIIDAHNAQLEVESEIGRGSCFRIIFCKELF